MLKRRQFVAAKMASELFEMTVYTVKILMSVLKGDITVGTIPCVSTHQDHLCVSAKQVTSESMTTLAQSMMNVSQINTTVTKMHCVSIL